MAIDKAEIWHLFTIGWEKYARPTQELCLDLAEGQVDKRTLNHRLSSIQRSPEIDTSRAFYYFGKAFEEIGLLHDELSLGRANLLYYSITLADGFLRELKEVIDSPNLTEIQAIARKYWEDFAPLKFEGLGKEVYLACDLLLAEQMGSGVGGIDSQANSSTTNRRNTAPGEAEDRILSALCLHHKYSDYDVQGASSLNMEPCGINALAKLANVAPASVTYFFKRKLDVGENEKPHHVYNRICRKGKILTFLKLCRGEFPKKALSLAAEFIDDQSERQ